MEHKSLRRPEVLERTRVVWLEHPRWTRDKRKKWALALGRIRKLLMKVRDEERRKEEEGSELEGRVEMARRRIHHDHSEEARLLFEEAVMTQRKKEQEEAEIASRIRKDSKGVIKLIPKNGKK
ncbi:hypothetical protein R1sor_022878 [Riccia sorocarpa]|uniref:Uncharacterized protein n=1 Tax=Riccia sorocarpa TaxID=122646 RepID=A0ABD3GL47_9MARC